MSAVTAPDTVVSSLNVSRETLERLQAYVDLLCKWQKAVNLVGPKTLDEVWTRHILDSAQLLPYIPKDSRNLLDIGSGAGLPGLILAILGVQDVHLIEADAKKITFLREAARITEVGVTLHHGRIEAIEPFPADVITARALASVDGLLGYTRAYRHETTVCLFLKGRGVEQELKEAATHWKMTVNHLPSATADDSVILRLEGIRNA
ncbi:MAG: 16S rRNA (guanine(527)-N(7))-methyltransferase RsmG [Alphaproteobacteria bacterium]|nr:16S rRNA (guanine(527)-N(7))-methyltransferase RsmG [Alphaproteobacteria bacterium]MBU0798898.1 16S rRNA (guanine(527)-N(7))-methyltransferase RsmG [Alphaproteobacteria bacterium]MBU0886286.1 16S rRNA (guanine(527)-N(7))-methyltransferase RsmG [Alphaproteobacteria bacterium]MBU1813518.1 16S rRNA (guanine(527)-N(7))-methyltransferase RsmG [Alphaproteobacteria bacterium]MBU2089982.1 16S rRNA (guanine(527)-N(7))-methyltransferase RsmG [Alphaproteobacteria bacterium]